MKKHIIGAWTLLLFLTATLAAQAAPRDPKKEKKQTPFLLFWERPCIISIAVA